MLDEVEKGRKRVTGIPPPWRRRRSTQARCPFIHSSSFPFLLQRCLFCGPNCWNQQSLCLESHRFNLLRLPLLRRGQRACCLPPSCLLPLPRVVVFYQSLVPARCRPSRPTPLCSDYSGVRVGKSLTSVAASSVALCPSCILSAHSL